jgi:glycosyltransferase involved in cell wall biosynthesis
MVLVFLDARALLVGMLGGRGARKVFYCLDVLEGLPVRRHLEAWCVRRVDVLVVTEPAKLSAWRGATELVPTLVVRNAPSRQTLAELRARAGRRIKVLEAVGWPPESRVLLHAGGVAKDFGLTEEIDALRLLPNDVRLAILGTPRLRAQGADGDRVRWLGYLEEGAWLDWLAAADVGLAMYTPRHAPHPRTAALNTPLSWNRIYWYLAAGVPLVVGGHPALAEFTRDTSTGVDVATPTSIGIAAAVQEALQYHDRFAGRAVELFETQFNYEAQSGPLIDALEALQSQARASTRDG